MPDDTRTLTLEPADTERLAYLCGPQDEHLRQIEEGLGVAIHNRGNHFQLHGPADAISAAETVLREFYAAANGPLTPERIHVGLRAAARDIAADDVPETPGGDGEIIKTRRGLIRGRGPNQRRYLENLRRCDLNFGIGPAGTGKTYLAVASAVDALERDRVRRMLLVRPAVEAGERLGFLPGDLAQKIDPYLRPLYDALYEMLGFERVARLIERNVIEIAPLAYMRGRAQPCSSMVLTPSGFRPIGELSVGDLVIGSDGESTPVLGVYPQGRKDIYRVSTQDGASTLCSAEHLWAVATRDDRRRGKPLRVLETQQMADRLWAGHYHRYELPLLRRPVVFEPCAIPMDPYALGLLLGDGCLTGSTTPAFATNDPELVLALERALPGVKLRSRGGVDYVLNRVAAAGGVITLENPVTAVFRQLGLWGTRSGTKFVPHAYLFNSVDVRLAVLQGLLDSDGGPVNQQGRSCRIQYTTASYRLRDDVLFLVRSLGGVAYYRTRAADGRAPGKARGREVFHRYDSYVLDIRLPDDIDPFRLQRKAQAYHDSGGGRPMRYIDRIEPAGTDEVVCIQVAAEDSLYVTEDFLLTHNTLNEAFIILDEAQNTTIEQMKMFLTRIGFGSTAVVTGDITQIDLPRHKTSGLRHAVDVLADVEGIAVTRFSSADVVRHPLVQRIVEAYDRHEHGE